MTGIKAKHAGDGDGGGSLEQGKPSRHRRDGRLNDVTRLARVLTNQGSLYRAKGRYAAAKQCFKRALALLGGVNDARMAAGEGHCKPKTCSNECNDDESVLDESDGWMDSGEIGGGYGEEGGPTAREVVEVKADVCNSLGVRTQHPSRAASLRRQERGSFLAAPEGPNIGAC